MWKTIKLCLGIANRKLNIAISFLNLIYLIFRHILIEITKLLALGVCNFSFNCYVVSQKKYAIISKKLLLSMNMWLWEFPNKFTRPSDPAFNTCPAVKVFKSGFVSGLICIMRLPDLK